MNIKPIKTLKDYRAALKELDSLMMAELGTPEGERLKIFAALIEEYEAKHHPIQSHLPLR